MGSGMIASDFILQKNDTLAQLPDIELHQAEKPARLTCVKSPRADMPSLSNEPYLDVLAPRRLFMRAHQIMSRPVFTVTPETTMVEAANLMLQKHVSGLPVVDATGKLVGMLSEGDFIRRSEIGTQRKRGRFLKFILGPGRAASDFVQEHGRNVSDIMTSEPLVTVREETPLERIVELMERNSVKRIPVIRDDKVVGIVSRSNLLQAVASLARDVPDPTADDDHIRNRVIDTLTKQDWCPFGLSVLVRDGIVHLSGVITEEHARQAAVVAAENVTGVKKVHDHLCWVDTMSGMYLNSPEDEGYAKAS
jgi:CBS domain-containing protein